MARVSSGTIYAPYFEATANPGEYIVSGAVYSNQTDPDAMGAYALEVGDVMFVPVMDAAVFALVPGVVNRYRITAVDVQDFDTVNLVIEYDQSDQQTDLPADGYYSIVSRPSQEKGYGFPVSPSIYPDLTLGADVAALATDTHQITDKIGGASSTGSNYKHVNELPETQWVVSHNMNSTDFAYSLFNSDGSIVFPDSIEVVDSNTLHINFLGSMSGKAIFVFL